MDGDQAAVALIRDFDWGSTALGPIERWSAPLRTVVGMLCRAPNPLALLWGADGIMIYNDAYAVIAGKRHPAMLGSKVREAWPEAADFNDHIMTEGLAGRSLSYRDLAMEIARNGEREQAWFNLDYAPVWDDDDSPAGVIAFVTETTGRIQDNAALRQSEEQFRVFAQAMPNHVWAAHADGFIFWLNDQSYSYTGAALGTMTGINAWGDVVHPDDLPVATACWRTALATGTVYETEFRIRRADGNYGWFLVRAEPVRDESGKVISWVGTNTDIDALRETENALRIANDTLEAQVNARTAELQAKEARLRTVFETSFGFQGLLDPDGRLLDANATSLTAIDSALDDIAGLSFWETPWFAGTPGMDETIRDAVARVARGDVVRQELLINLPVGGWRWFDFVLRPIFSTQGDVIAIVPEALETTERRAAEEALRQSQKLEAMGQLTGGVAHDFNNLLTPIIGTLDLLSRREIGGEREQRLIGGGLQSAERAKMLVQRLLAFARRQPLQPQPVDVAALIASMSDLIASTSGPRIRIDMDIAAWLPAATAEVNQLEMALLNLAVNARDAMPEGGTLTIAAATADIIDGEVPGMAAGRYVKITVSDTGTGMDEHTKRHAIEPFFSTKGIGKGTGLGLSMVHGLASQLGGALNISSKLGLGTSIELLLPATAASVVPIDQPTDPADAVIGAGTVLLVDDEDPVRQTTAEMLIELGYHVIEAHSGEAAIELIDQHAIDMIVTDHLMGGMTGTALIEHVRRTAPDLPVLVITGYADAAGIAADVPRLTKPFRSAELAAMLATIQQR
ncbi:MAG: PAS domain-containing protein [Sphingomonas sp.]|nr:PAS domain-containing protein [Sphingomonas sp.]